MQSGAKWDKEVRGWYLTKPPSKAQTERLKPWLPDTFNHNKQDNVK